MSNRKMSEAIPSAISSLESRAGQLHFAWQDGPTIDPSGPVPVPANHSVPQENGKAKKTNGTCGRRSSGSSKPVSPQSSSASKSHHPTLSERLAEALKARLLSGSMEYSMTWKEHRTPAGRQIFRLRASARRISDSGCTGEPHGWPSPKATEPGDSVETWESRRDRHGSHSSGGPMGMPLAVAVLMTGWPTATVQDSIRQPAIGATTPNITLNHAANLVGWNTPRATDGSNGGPNQAGGALPADAAMVSGWATPTTRDHKDGVRERDRELFVGATGMGHWSDYDIVQCRDGKARRIPTQSGFFAVVDGLSAGMDGVRLACLDRFPLAGKVPNRVMLLKGAGNAIVPEQAAEFIQAFEEAVANQQ